MKNELTSAFVTKVLKLGKNYKVKYSVQFINIEVINIDTEEVRYINIHEFIHTHCCDYLVSYANGLKASYETKHSDTDKRIAVLHFEINLIVPNLLEGKNIDHIETFSGPSELLLFIKAVEWLIKYRENNPKLSKFWVNKL